MNNSSSTILILEDDVERIKGFAQAFQNSPHEIFITDQVDQCIEILQKNVIDLAYLDHDLGGKVFVDPAQEPTGLHVAQWIAKNPSRAPLVCFIHSHNPSGSKSMAAALHENPNITTVVAPFPSCITQYRVSPK